MKKESLAIVQGCCTTASFVFLPAQILQKLNKGILVFQGPVISKNGKVSKVKLSGEQSKI